MKSEIGLELSVTDLRTKQVVVIAPPGHAIFITMWVTAITADTVTFYSGAHNWSIVNFIRDDRLYDDQDRLVQVFEYLGTL